MENGGNPRFPGARFVVGNGGEGRGVLAQEGGQREKGIARDRGRGRMRRRRERNPLGQGRGR